MLSRRRVGSLVLAALIEPLKEIPGWLIKLKARLLVVLALRHDRSGFGFFVECDGLRRRRLCTRRMCEKLKTEKEEM